MLGPQSQPQFFTYERQIEDSTIHVGAIGAPADGRLRRLRLAATVATTEGPTRSTAVPARVDRLVGPYGLIGGQVIVGDEETPPPRRAAPPAPSTSSSTATRAPAAGSPGRRSRSWRRRPSPTRGAADRRASELDYVVPERADPPRRPQGAASFDDAPVVDAHDGPVTIDTPSRRGHEPCVAGAARLGRPARRARSTCRPPRGRRRRARLPQRLREGRDHPAQPGRLRLTRSRTRATADYGEPNGPGWSRRAYPLRYDEPLLRDVEPMLPGDHWVSVTVAAAPEDRGAARRPDGAHPRGDAGPMRPRRPTRTPSSPRAGAPGRTATRRRRRTSSATESSPPSRPATRSREGDEADDEWWGPRRGVGPRRRRGQPGLLRGRCGVADPASRSLTHTSAQQQPAADEQPEHAEDQQQERCEHTRPGRCRGRGQARLLLLGAPCDGWDEGWDRAAGATVASVGAVAWWGPTTGGHRGRRRVAHRRAREGAPAPSGSGGKTSVIVIGSAGSGGRSNSSRSAGCARSSSQKAGRPGRRTTLPRSGRRPHPAPGRRSAGRRRRTSAGSRGGSASMNDLVVLKHVVMIGLAAGRRRQQQLLDIARALRRRFAAICLGVVEIAVERLQLEVENRSLDIVEPRVRTPRDDLSIGVAPVIAEQRELLTDRVVVGDEAPPSPKQPSTFAG